MENILKCEEMERANPVGMPMDLNTVLEPNLDNNEHNCLNLYVRLFGELQFLANVTWPDNAFAVNCLAAYIANLSMQQSIKCLEKGTQILKRDKRIWDNILQFPIVL